VTNSAVRDSTLTGDSGFEAHAWRDGGKHGKPQVRLPVVPTYIRVQRLRQKFYVQTSVFATGPVKFSVAVRVKIMGYDAV
jgi:hypothetical protein